VKSGPDGALYGTALGGNQDCQNGCGSIFRLRPSPVACRTASCSWTKKLLYSFNGSNDGAYPVSLAFDQAGNLYGTTGAGGAYGQGVVYQLVLSNGSWTEKVLYNFTGGNDGGSPVGLVAGSDGNLYGGTDNGGAYGSGVIYQLVPSGGSWTQHVLYTFNGQYGVYGGYFRQDSSGNLYGTTAVRYSFGWLRQNVFMLSPSNGGWAFTIIWQAQHQYEYIGGLAVDTAGDLYGVATNTGESNQLVFEIFERMPTGNFQNWVRYGFYLAANFGVVVDRRGNLYGMDDFCGTYGYGRVWQFTGFSDLSP
jgi:uncharacterized repeat protein (TIGR03803 family)